MPILFLCKSIDAEVDEDGEYTVTAGEVALQEMSASVFALSMLESSDDDEDSEGSEAEEAMTPEEKVGRARTLFSLDD